MGGTTGENEKWGVGEGVVGFEAGHEDRGAALVIGSRRQFRQVVRGRVAFDADDLAEVIHGMGAIARAPADAEEEDSSAVGFYLCKQVRDLFDRCQIHLADDLGRFTHVLLSITHYSPPPLK